MGEQVVAVDLGGTLTKTGLSAPDGTISHPERLATASTAGRVEVGWLTGLLGERLRALGSDAYGWSVVVPGVLDPRSGTVRAAPNLGWSDVPLGQQLTATLDRPGVVGHDVRAGGLAEWRLGRGVGSTQLLFLALGTGIAGAMVVDGRLLEADGYAGELGHLRVSAAAEQRCACGLFGCLETVASAAGVGRSYERLTGEPTRPEVVAGRARTGDQAAQQAFAVAAAALAEALAVYCAVAGPELVIIGGGLSRAADLLLAPVRTQLADRLSFHRRPELAAASLGADAGLIGAGLLGWDRLGPR